MLNDLQVKAAKSRNRLWKLTDGKGLHLVIYPTGTKRWAWNYREGAKQKTMYFGVYPEVKLADARAAMALAKERLKSGQDPSSKAGQRETLEAIAKEWLKAQAVAWTPRYSALVAGRLERDVFPDLGAKPIDAIKAPDILMTLRKIEDRGALDVAKRQRQTLGAIFRYAIAIGKAERDPSSDLKGALKPNPRVKHMAALKANEIGEFMVALRAYDGEPQTALAIDLIMHTFVRTNELIFAQWSEIEGDLWRIPADRMKMRAEHLVPLTKSSRGILDRLKAIAGDSKWIVPGTKGKPVSNNTMLFALYRMGYHGRATMHGMRSLASTALNESGLWSSDAIERQLAHAPRNAIRAAYNQAQYLPERRKMMDWWSRYLKAAEEKKPRDLSRLLG